MSDWKVTLSKPPYLARPVKLLPPSKHYAPCHNSFSPSRGSGEAPIAIPRPGRLLPPWAIKAASFGPASKGSPPDKALQVLLCLVAVAHPELLPLSRPS